MGPGTSLRTYSDRHDRLSSIRCRSPTRRVPIHARGFAPAAVFDSGWQPPAQTTSRIREQRRLHAVGHAALRVVLILALPGACPCSFHQHSRPHEVGNCEVNDATNDASSRDWIRPRSPTTRAYGAQIEEVATTHRRFARFPRQSTAIEFRDSTGARSRRWYPDRFAQ